jgi:hypothetical protein
MKRRSKSAILEEAIVDIQFMKENEIYRPPTAELESYLNLEKKTYMSPGMIRKTRVQIDRNDELSVTNSKKNASFIKMVTPSHITPNYNSSTLSVFRITREYCLSYPGKLSYEMRLLWAWCLSNFNSVDDKLKIVVYAKVLAAIHPKGRDIVAKHKTPNPQLAADFVEEFYNNIPADFQFMMTEPIVNLGRVVEFLPEMPNMLECLLEDPSLVDLLTGNEMASHEKELVLSKISEVAEVQHYINNQKLDLSIVKENMVRQIPLVWHKVPPLGRSCHRIVVGKILANTSVKLSAKVNTARLYYNGASFQILHRALRNAAFKDFTQIDLKHCQISVIRKLWHMPELDEYIRDGFWTRLLSELSHTKVTKDQVKTLVYAIIFGSDTYAREKELVETGLSEYDSHFIIYRCPLIFKLFKAREEMVRKIIYEGYEVVDAYGNKIIRKSGAKDKIRPKDACKMLAAQAQSYEIRLLLPAIMFLIRNNLPIYALMHDGLILEPTAFQFYAMQLKALVDAEAEKLGIQTWLEVEKIK